MNRKKNLALAGLALGFTVLLTGCGTTTGDRDAGGGAKADTYKDAQQVVVYRNANDVPNVANFCLGEYGWASTLSGGDSGADKSSALVRFPEYDVVCNPGLKK